MEAITMRVVPAREPFITEKSVRFLKGTSRRQPRPRKTGRKTGRTAHSQIKQHLTAMYQTLISMRIRPSSPLAPLVSDLAEKRSVRAGPPETYGDIDMQPLEIFRDLRDSLRAVCGLKPIDRTRYVTGGTAYMIFVFCHWDFHGGQDLDFRRRRCLLELTLYDEHGEHLPDYVKSAIYRKTTFENVPEKLREAYRWIAHIEDTAEMEARLNERPNGVRTSFRTLSD